MSLFRRLFKGESTEDVKKKIYEEIKARELGKPIARKQSTGHKVPD